MSLLGMMLRSRLGRIFERKLAQNADKLEFFARGVQLRVMVEILGLDRGKPSTFGTVPGHISDAPPRINVTRFAIQFSAPKVLADRKAAWL